MTNVTYPNPLHENEPRPTPTTIQTILPIGSSKYAANIRNNVWAKNDPQVKYLRTLTTKSLIKQKYFSVDYYVFILEMWSNSF